MLFKKPC